MAGKTPAPLPPAVTASGEAITAAARQIDPGNQHESEAIKKRRKAWQEEAWKYYDEIGEVWFAHEFVGNALRRIRLYPAYQPDPEQPPISVEDDPKGDDTGEPIVAATAAQAQAEIGRLSQGAGMGDLLHGLGVNLGVPGEAYLVGVTDDAGERWGTYSPDQLVRNDKGQTVLVEEPGARDGVVLTPENSTSVRVWRPHPRWSGLANSPMRAILDQCDELQILSRHIRSAGRSRIAGAGVWLVPKEVSFGPVEPAQDDEQGNARHDQLTQELLTHMTTPIADEGVAAAVVPMIVRAPAEFIPAFTHVVFERPLDPVAAAQRQELIKRIANGLDIPAEILLGLGDSNHWSAWQIDEQTFKSHIEPLVIMICNALTVGFLRPALGAAPDADRAMVWYDASGLLGHPNRAQDAKDAHEAIVISDTAYRGYLGFPEEDAPDEEEVARRVAQAAASRPAAPAPVDAGGTDKAPPADPGQASVTASAARAVASSLGWRLAQIDRELRSRLLTAADQVMFAGLEKAGAKLRRKVGRNSELASIIADSSQHLVAYRLGKLTVNEKLGFSDEGLVENVADPLREKYEVWVSRAQRQARALLAAEDREDVVDWDAAEAQQKDDRDAGWVLLSGAMAAAAASLLYDPAPAFPANGEFDGTLRVPPGAVRESLSRAGGATGEKTRGGAVMDGNGQPSGGVATGQTMRDLFVKVGRLFDGYVWIYGDPSSRDRNYEPHVALDEVEFNSWEDAVLSNDADWPDEPYFFPGDHLYCQCDFALTEQQSDTAEEA